MTRPRTLAIIAEHFGVEVTAETNLAEDLFDDSLDPIELLCVLEDELEVSIPDDYAPDCVTAGDLCDLIDGLTGERKAA